MPTHITAEAAYTSVCQSPKIWWSSAGSRWRTLVCFHSFPQVLQYTVVEVTPITVVFTQSARVTRCRRSRCHQYRIAHYMNRLISLRRIYFLSRVPAVAGAVASVPAISTDRPSSRPSPESSSAQWFLRRHRWLRTHLERPSRHRPASALCPLTLAVSAVQRVRRVGRGIRGSWELPQPKPSGAALGSTAHLPAPRPSRCDNHPEYRTASILFGHHRAA